MANKLRWRYGDTQPVKLPVDSATVIEIGDLVYLDSDDAKPVATLSDAGSASLNQQSLHDALAGVAMQASASGDDQPIRVATTGVFEFDCASATFEVGDYIGGAENTAGDALENQKVAAASGVTEAIGRCAKRVNPASDTVYVDIVSTLMKGGPQAAA